MAPHATSPVRTTWSFSSTQQHGSGSLADGEHRQHTMLPRADAGDLHDLICVGFGPASLAIATALHDSIEFQQKPSVSSLSEMPKVVFLEKQSSFRWHAGMQLDGATMQISWIKDFATLRNPRSVFTFLNYLWTKGRLLQFSNLGTFLPTRLEYESYMKWIAEWFRSLVEYNQECTGIEPLDQSDDQQVSSFIVTTRNLVTGEIEKRRAKRVVIACGGKPFIPSAFPQNSGRVIHSSSYTWAISELCSEQAKPYNFVVIGSGQSAAEIFHDLQSRYPNCRATLLIRQASLRPSDDSPFVNEIFDPERVDDFFETADEIRSSDISNERATNYGVVRLELLDKIYNDLYMQRVKHEDAKEWQHCILPYREVTSIKDLQDRVRLQIHNSEPLHRQGGGRPKDDVMDVDAVIVAAGYRRNAHDDLLCAARRLMPLDGSKNPNWKVRRDYSVIFRPNAVANDAGIWLQGSNEATHGLSDSLLSILAVRGQEVVDSMFKKELYQMKQGTTRSIHKQNGSNAAPSLRPPS